MRASIRSPLAVLPTASSYFRCEPSPLFPELFMNDKRYQKVDPRDPKDIRFSAACTPVAAGVFHLPAEAPWLSAFKHQLQGFYRALGRDHPLNRDRLNSRQKPRRW
jgi:hypothetical protein